MAVGRHPLIISALLAAASLPPAAAAAALANGERPDLLPEHCGRRQVRVEHATRPFVVGPGNTTAYYGQFPWQARLVVYDPAIKSYKHQCGGIIVTQRHVVTAAHCVVRVSLRGLLVRVGDYSFGEREQFEQEFAVGGYRVHHLFTGAPGLPHDIALLRLQLRAGPGIQFGPYVTPACLPLPFAEYEPFLSCQVSGWGKTSDAAPVSEVLRSVSVPLVSDNFCSAPEVYGDRFLAGSMFCSGPTDGGADACGGDSGGPLVCPDQASGRFVAYGVVSSGDIQGCGRQPGLYTKVSAYVNWLLRRLQLDLEEINNSPVQLLATSPASSEAPSQCGKISFRPSSRDGAALVQSPQHFPWMVTLFLDKDGSETRCGGAIISDRWIVTTATCAPVGWTFKAQMGDISPDGDSRGSPNLPPQYMDIEEAVRHPRSGKSKDAPNIALMKTKSKIAFSDRVSPICLPNDLYPLNERTGKNLIFVGWGAPTYRDADAPWALKWARMRVVDLDSCRANYSAIPQGETYFGRSTFCTKFIEPTADFQCGVNQGDSGSIFMDELQTAGTSRWYAVGLAVSGVGCGSAQFPDLNVALRPSLAWMRSVVGSTLGSLDQQLAAGASGSDGDAGSACAAADGGAGRCLRLADCAVLLRRVAGQGAAQLRQHVCGLDAAATPLICCPAPAPAPAAIPCGSTAFSPPARSGAALVESTSDLPWSALLFGAGDSELPVCGAAVISDRWLVTSATCVRRGGQLPTVRLGDLRPRDASDDSAASPPLDMEIVQVVRHPDLTSEDDHYPDVALLKTKSAIPFSSAVSPICLRQSPRPASSLVGKNLLFAGWGAPKFGDNVSKLALKWARLKVVDSNECKANHSKRASFTISGQRYFGAETFCTQFPERNAKFLCAVNQGDQGSVFMELVNEAGVNRWYAVGVPVSGIGCGSDAFPDINIALEPFAPWIHSVISAST